MLRSCDISPSLTFFCRLFASGTRLSLLPSASTRFPDCVVHQAAFEAPAPTSDAAGLAHASCLLLDARTIAEGAAGASTGVLGPRNSRQILVAWFRISRQNSPLLFAIRIDRRCDRHKIPSIRAVVAECAEAIAPLPWGVFPAKPGPWVPPLRTQKSRNLLRDCCRPLTGKVRPMRRVQPIDSKEGDRISFRNRIHFPSKKKSASGLFGDRPRSTGCRSNHPSSPLHIRVSCSVSLRCHANRDGRRRREGS